MKVCLFVCEVKVVYLLSLFVCLYVGLSVFFVCLFVCLVCLCVCCVSFFDPFSGTGLSHADFL